jgi:ATP-binding cassette subfamily C (CFTR/MRP) protein 1
MANKTLHRALARAIFARHEIVLLDDTFSALDGKTEDRVFNNLLGPSGLLRRLRATIVLVSNNGECRNWYIDIYWRTPD